MPFLSHDFTPFAFRVGEVTGQAENYGVCMSPPSMECGSQRSPSHPNSSLTLLPGLLPPMCLALNFRCFPKMDFYTKFGLTYIVLSALVSLPSSSPLANSSFQVIQMSKTLGRLLQNLASLHLHSVSYSVSIHRLAFPLRLLEGKERVLFIFGSQEVNTMPGRS